MGNFLTKLNFKPAITHTIQGRIQSIGDEGNAIISAKSGQKKIFFYLMENDDLKSAVIDINFDPTDHHDY